MLTSSEVNFVLILVPKPKPSAGSKAWTSEVDNVQQMRTMKVRSLDLDDGML